MTEIVRSAFTGDVDPLYLVGAMAIAAVVVAVVFIAGKKRK